MSCVFKNLVLVVAAGLALGGCGGGGGDDAEVATPTPTPIPTPTPTPTPTPAEAISLAPFKAVYGGTAATDTQYSFNLSGADAGGKAYTATYSLASKGATVFEGQNVTWTQEKFNLSTGGQIVAQETGDIYWTTPNVSVYKIAINGNGVVVGYPVPRLIDSIASGYSSSGSLVVPYIINQVTVRPTIYQMYNSISGQANVIMGSTYTTVHSAAKGFHITPEGNPYKMELAFTYNGIEISLKSDN